MAGGRDEAVTGRARLEASQHIYLVLVALLAFGLYWLSSFILQAREATTHFGADSWYYAELAKENVIWQIADNYFLDRVARFHPVTVVLAAAWMKVFSPLTPWLSHLQILKALFAAAGAVGVWAAVSAFAALVPRRFVPLFGLLYAVSFGVWYFSSIEESKIISASLCALYIAGYLRLRDRWTTGGAAALTAILLVACLNEMVSGFLIVIPVIDTLARRGLDWSQLRWIAGHALAGPLALVLIEGVLHGRWVAAAHPEGTSHLGLLLADIADNDYFEKPPYQFLINWFFFNIAAPTVDASYGVAEGTNWLGHPFKGSFEPALANYFSSPISTALVVWFGAMTAASVLPRYRAKGTDIPAAILAALAAYVLLRTVFFYVFAPGEPLLFSSPATLTLLLVLAVLFVASKVPAKRLLLSVLAGLLFLVNGRFIIGQ